ncbi:NASP-related protein sim3 [Tripterygium wilfordii]|uniref:NASP-related protein sim3 n=1 Tax=Tripterygium wilfordii TaxID=458696 RepID=A0A7J7E3S9_TRIWF|nr:protein HGV2 [Tripterygium wilfordii]KAF5752936.1 NASP-related protein sim3 [Tripterygium wilfordii]
MVEEAPASESSVTVALEQLPHTETSIEATIESVAVGGTTDSTCNNNNNNNNNVEISAPTSEGDHEKSLESAAELTEKGTKALRENDYGEAADCLSRALEIRVAYHGELSLECVHSYYQYGRALLYKAQEEADPLATVPKKEGDPPKESDKEGSVKDVPNGESSVASVASNVTQDAGLNPQEGVSDDTTGGKDQDEDDEDEDSDAEDLAEADEDESDLDLAWKMLDVARAIAEKHPGDTMDKVDILSALAEVALEREDIETSLSDYEKALSILERLVEPDSRYIAELNFRICLCLEIGCKPKEATLYCQKAISVCKSRLERLTNETKSSAESATSSVASALDESVEQSTNVAVAKRNGVDKQAEIETLTGLLGDLEKKLEDLQTFAQDPKSILAEILGMTSGKGKGGGKSTSLSIMSSSQSPISTSHGSGNFDSPTVSTAHTNGAAGVTHLGVVGRGVKRVQMNTVSAESSPTKKPSLEPSSDKGDASSK